MDMSLKPAEDVKTVPLVGVGLVGGWLLARETGIRPLGGVLLAVAGAAATRAWWVKRGPATAAALATTYVVGFGLSHPLANEIGAWPSVLTVTGVTAAGAYLASDRLPARD